MPPLGGSEGDGDDDPRDPRRRLAGIASAALGWPPAQFWKSTPHEFWAAFEVWKSMNVSSEE
ncbi:phage tail assembly chaperone [Sphingomonas paucimobilis]|uniref:phage tail assembly chaperone n=1 Tax=Sphingomonas paucimobilis TaxID=13689 RepID=UPI003C6F118C